MDRSCLWVAIFRPSVDFSTWPLKNRNRDMTGRTPHFSVVLARMLICPILTAAPRLNRRDSAHEEMPIDRREVRPGGKPRRRRLRLAHGDSPASDPNSFRTLSTANIPFRPSLSAKRMAIASAEHNFNEAEARKKRKCHLGGMQWRRLWIGRPTNGTSPSPRLRVGLEYVKRPAN
jgi:hypothetical protein